MRTPLFGLVSDGHVHPGGGTRATRLTVARNDPGGGGWRKAIHRDISPFIRTQTVFVIGRPMDFLSHDSVDPQLVSHLADLCFGPARMRRTASILREGAPRIADASFVALDGDQLVGSVELHLLNWSKGSTTREIAILGPLVSHPDRRGERIGTRLMDLALAEADKQRLPVMLIGDEPYYGRWGFSSRHTGEWVLPGPVDPARLLLRARAPHRFNGAGVLRAPGAALEAA